MEFRFRASQVKDEPSVGRPAALAIPPSLELLNVHDRMQRESAVFQPGVGRALDERFVLAFAKYENHLAAAGDPGAAEGHAGLAIGAAQVEKIDHLVLESWLEMELDHELHAAPRGSQPVQ